MIVHARAVRVLSAQGVSQAKLHAIADTFTAAERNDCKSYGLFRLSGYVSAVRSGKVTPDAVPEVCALAPAIVQIVQVDDKHGFASLALQVGRAACREGPPLRHCRPGGDAYLPFCRVMARGRGLGAARFGIVRLHRGHELCGASGRAQAALWDESHGVRLATGGSPAVGLRSGVKHHCTGRNSVASARWPAPS
jgi:hypothetical protein